MRNLPPYLFRILHQSRNAFFSLFFPWPCSICGELQKYAGVVCEPCGRSLPRIPDRCCRICGAPFPEHWRVKVCPDCYTKRPELTRIRSVFLYEGPVIQMLHDIKFGKRARPLLFFAEELYLLVLRRFPRSIDAIVPVPLHRVREWERTFDQAALLAEHLQRFSGIPLRKALIRRKNTPPQTSLSGQARRKNLRGAFRLRKGEQRLPRSILLIDDVITTGATLEACARILRKAGARRIYGLTIARAVLK